MRALPKRWPLLFVAVLAAGMLLVLSCGGEEKKEEGTPGATAKATAIGVGDTTGVTDTEIKLGIHIPLSQNPAAAYAPVAYGIRPSSITSMTRAACTVGRSPSSSATTTTTRRTRWR